MRASTLDGIDARSAMATAVEALDLRVDRNLSAREQARHAVMLSLCSPSSAQCEELASLSAREWTALLHWLDTSGLALYFLDRLSEIGRCEILPAHARSRLERNLADNTERMVGLIAESLNIQRCLREAGVSFAVLKGFSLWPVSAPKLELRSQLDLDFLVAAEDAPAARAVLEDFGYVLDRVHGRNWDFKSDAKSMGEQPRSFDNLYKDGTTRSAELHLDSAPAGSTALLSRVEEVEFCGEIMPVLPAVELLLGQGLHVFKHMYRGFVRGAHLLEFRRNVIAHYGDEAFWSALEEAASSAPAIAIRLGAVIQLITAAMGEFAPVMLTCWTAERLPARARLWFASFGRRAALASFPGSKLYLLLWREIDAKMLPPAYSLRRSLLPFALPEWVAPAIAGETLRENVGRYRRQLLFIGSRLRFHVVEGICFVRAASHWRRLRNGLAR